MKKIFCDMCGKELLEKDAAMPDCAMLHATLGDKEVQITVTFRTIGNGAPDLHRSCLVKLIYNAE